MQELKEMLIHSLGGFTAEEYADAIQTAQQRDIITRVFKKAADLNEIKDKLFVPTDELWKCETCFYHSSGRCTTYCDASESYRPAWSELTKYALKKEEVIQTAKWKMSFHGQGKPYRYHCTHCDEDMTKEGNLIASKYCPDCGLFMSTL